MAQRNVLLSARPSTRNVFITIMQVLVLFTISITAAGDVRSMRMSAGMFIFPGGQSHGFDIAEVAGELVHRGVNVFVSIASFDVQPFRQYLDKSGRNVDIRFYDGDFESASRMEEDAKLWLVNYDLEDGDEVKEFEASWLREKHGSQVIGMNYTSELHDNMRRDYMLQIVKSLMKNKDSSINANMKKFISLQGSACRDLMRDALSVSAFSSVDMMILDPTARCGVLSAVRFQKPFGLAFFGSIYPRWSVSSTIQPWVPAFSSELLPSSMSILDATRNIASILNFKYNMKPKLWAGFCDLIKEFDIDADVPVTFWSSQCTRVAKYADTLPMFGVYFTELEAPREIFDNEHLVGSLTPKPAMPLPLGTDGVAEFVESADKGFIFISLGTIGTLEMDQMLHIRDAIESLNVRALWKVTGKMSDDDTLQLQRSGRVFLTPWVSQNDVLGHPNILAFFTHCGRHSLEEGAYHGVPLLMMPLFADQMGNAVIGLQHGLGVRVDRRTFTSESLSDSLRSLINRTQNDERVNSPFYEASQRLSARLKSHPKRPIERAGDILERVITEVVRTKEYGGDHMLLVPRVRRMTHMEYLMPYILFLGIAFAALAIACLLVFGALYSLFKFSQLLYSSAYHFHGFSFCNISRACTRIEEAKKHL